MSNSTTIQTFPETLTFDQFLEWYPEDGRYELVEGEYQVRQFRGFDRIESPTFPELDLIASRFCKSTWRLEIAAT